MGGVRLEGHLQGLLIGLAGRGLTLVGDAADGEHRDGGEDAQDDDDNEKFDEGESLVLLPM